METKSKQKKRIFPEILVPNGAKKKLAKDLNASNPTVRKALSGESKSLLSIKIRMAAIELGGMEMDDLKVTKNEVFNNQTFDETFKSQK